jgi:hypothetical protein
VPSFGRVLVNWWQKSKDGDRKARAVEAGLVGPIFAAWERSAADSVDQMIALKEKGRLTTQLEAIVCNLAHTFHNRLGLTVRDEVIVAGLMLSEP